ncbi:YceI family protein [Pseudochryseolinea flava]|uniref:YceI family protein n=1 Tax=Pseudochryseolinea flava TaxID=2059302 RepID=UPI0016281DC2|nr:YceI family protein [Pseudochryseolinea flava]
MATAIATKTKWAIDTTHSEAQFKVKHLVISTVTGYFKKFQGDVTAEDEKFDGAEVNVTIETNSIDTNQADRDGHLKSEDFFAAERFPNITFNGVLEIDGDYKLVGELTIRDVKKPITLDVDFGGVTKDPWGNIKAGFEVNGKINRKDFGLNWSALTEAGGMVVGEEVKLHFNIELTKIVA